MSRQEFIAKRQAMIQGGKILARVVKELNKYLVAGIETREIDSKAASLIKSFGGDISFNKVPGYKWATCLSVNEVVVHGVPNEYKLRQGDILKLDIGVYYGGYHVDYGETHVIGKDISKPIQRFLDTGKNTLLKLIKAAKKDVYIGNLSKIIETEIEGAGYKVIVDLTGHAVGKALHEDPLIPGFVVGDIKRTPRLISGNAYALEVIYSFSDNRVVYAGEDRWGLRTKGGSLSACFEQTVFIDEDKTLVLVE